MKQSSLRTHDIILGDLGRDAAIRLVSIASGLERELLTKLQKNNVEFRDEHRLWTFELHSSISLFKPEVRKLSSLNSIPDRFLVGMGYSPEELAKNLASVAKSRLANIPDVYNCRVVVPCNTIYGHLDLLSSELGEEFEHVPVIGPADAVLPILLDQKVVGFIPIGLGLAVDGYVKAAGKIGKISVQRPTPDIGKLVEDAIKARVSLGGEESIIAEIERKVRDRFGNLPLVCACTDLEIKNSTDSLRSLARYIVESAYQFLEK